MHSALSVLLSPSPLPLLVPVWAQVVLAWEHRTGTPHSQDLTCPREQRLRRVRMMLFIELRGLVSTESKSHGRERGWSFPARAIGQINLSHPEFQDLRYLGLKNSSLHGWHLITPK